MTEQFIQIDNHLNSDQKLNYIDVMNVETTKFVDKALYIADIVDKFGDLNGYFTSLLKDGLEKIQVFNKKKHGSSHRLIGAVVPLKLGVKSDKKETENNGLNSPSFLQPQNTDVNMNQNNSQDQYNYYRDKFNDEKEKVTDLKQDILDLKTEIRGLKAKGDTDHDLIRSLQADLAVKDREMDLALKMQALENKNFLDSENFGKLISEGKSFALGMSAKNSGGASQLSAPAKNYGFYKKAMVNSLDLEPVTEEVVRLMLSAGTGVVEKGDVFTEKLKALIAEFNIIVEKDA